MTGLASGRELSLSEAIKIFRSMPTEWQLASLHPAMVAVDARRDAHLQPVHWSYRENDHCLLHSFQLGTNPGLDFRDIQSAYGYGGPLSNTEDANFLKAADQAFRRWALSNSVIAEFLRFHPLVPHARWYSGDVAPNRETVHIDLAKDLFQNYKTRRRTDVRRFLESGLRVEQVSAELMREVFPDMYRRNMDKIGATGDYYFPAAYFDALFRFEATENWLAYLGGQAVAGAVILVSEQARVAEYHLGANALEAERHRASIGLLHVAAEQYQVRSYRYLYLGGGRSTASDDSLLFFKKGYSSATGQYKTASKIYDPARYALLKEALPEKASSGRVLFYKG